MTPNTLAREVTVYRMTADTDEYGQKRTEYYESFTDLMAIIDSSQYTFNRPDFKGMDAVGLTHNRTVDTSCEIADGVFRYRVKKVIPSGRFSQLILEEMK